MLGFHGDVPAFRQVFVDKCFSPLYFREDYSAESPPSSHESMLAEEPLPVR